MVVSRKYVILLFGMLWSLLLHYHHIISITRNDVYNKAKLLSFLTMLVSLKFIPLPHTFYTSSFLVSACNISSMPEHNKHKTNIRFSAQNLCKQIDVGFGSRYKTHSNFFSRVCQSLFRFHAIP